MQISDNSVLLDYIKEQNADVKLFSLEHHGSDWEISNAIINGLAFEYSVISRIIFINCVFANCRFENFEINGVEFKGCTFVKGVFQNVIFMDCTLENCAFDGPFSNTLYFGMSSLSQVKFNEMEFQFTTFSDCLMEDVAFSNGWWNVGKIESGDHFYLFKGKVMFDNTQLSSCAFFDMDLTLSRFRNSELGISLANSVFSSETFVGNKKSNASIDFYTILNSDNAPPTVLRDVFSITAYDVREIIKRITSEQTSIKIFISYSFKDEIFAEMLNQQLINSGITTFFWKKDAPGGKRMKEIMADKIREYDYFLFISSENSLKSESCHFEIAEARKKYQITWKNTLLPIHIDDFFLQVEEMRIPTANRKLFWENISELREFHSLSFQPINSDTDGKININPEMFSNLLASIRANTYFEGIK